MINTADTRLLDADTVAFRRDEYNAVVMTREGDDTQVALMSPMFPLSAPDLMIAVRDYEGEEIGVIPDLEALDEDSGRVVRRMVEMSFFLPVVREVTDVSEYRGVVTWAVETDRGLRSFEVRNIRANLRKLGSGRILIRDVDGNRYDIPSIDALSPRARWLIDPYL